ncbi:hypothetical protein HID58_021432 [Brassica napus]|uniref:Uncharacterized protein n=1 Tax=Brassica napus TaxID=3708 RepID=A0ABQ8CWF0_BRANA|nr:hypothetical protein HID58_021432 [Brassica napus]
MSKYNGAEGIIASFSFILFVLSWILWSTSYEVVLELDKDKHPIDASLVKMSDPILKVKMSTRIDDKGT